MRPLLLLLLPAIALAAPLPEGLRQAADRLSKHETVRARWALTRSSALFFEDQTQAGAMELRRSDGRLLWLIDEGPQVLFAGGRVHPAFRTEAEAGAEGSEGFSMPGGSDFGSLLAALFTLEPEALSQRFEASPAGEGKWRLKPTDPGTAALFSQVTMTLGGEPFAVREVAIDEPTGDRLVLAFPEVSVGVKLDPQRFATPKERSAAP